MNKTELTPEEQAIFNAFDEVLYVTDPSTLLWIAMKSSGFSAERLCTAYDGLIFNGLLGIEEEIAVSVYITPAGKKALKDR